MSPNFMSNDFVISVKSCFTHYHIGDVIVIQHASLGIIIKRIIDMRVDNDQRFVYLQGDNLQASTASDVMGWQPTSAILGKVRKRFSPKRP